MARNDLLINLVRASLSGDKSSAARVIEAMVAEERTRQHNVLADKLSALLRSSPAANGDTARKSISDAALKPGDLLHQIVPRRDLESLVLPKECRETVDEIIEEQFRADILRSFSLQPRHKILLLGPPGNGKTSLAEAIAEALAVPFFVVRYETIIGSFLGETASRLKRAFDFARTMPCVLFFDEFDALGKERGDVHETGEIKRVVTSLLLQIDELPSYTVIVAATNHQELLDRAAWRRFEVRIDLPRPSPSAINQFLKMHLQDVPNDGPQRLAEIAREMRGSSFSDIEQFCLNLKRRAVLKPNPDFGKLTKESLTSWKRNTGLGRQTKQRSGKTISSDSILGQP